MAPGALYRSPKEPGASSLLVADQDLFQIAVGDANVYWVNSGEYDSNTGSVLKTAK